MTNNEILKLNGIYKTYPGVVALGNVSLSLEIGQIHSVLGENGAGKSTLAKILSGSISPDRGEIIICNRNYSKLTPKLSQKLGISVIYQEPPFLTGLSVTEYIFLGKELRKGFFLDEKKMKQITRSLFDAHGLNIDPDAEVSSLSVGELKMIEIVKTLERTIKVLILDEPAASISIEDFKMLYEIMNKLKKSGTTLLYITQRIEEVFNISDKVTVIRDGRHILTSDIGKTSRKELKSLISGRNEDEQFPPKTSEVKNVIFRIENLCNDKIHKLSFDLKKSEILGLAGLESSGRAAFTRAIFGADAVNEGRVLINGKEVKIKTPFDAIRNGIGLLSLDNEKHGLILNISTRYNFPSITSEDNQGYSDKYGLNNTKAQRSHIRSIEMDASKLGMISKYLIMDDLRKFKVAQWISNASSILIFDDPTKKMDTKMKYELYSLMCELTRQGLSIIFISSDTKELLGMSDRIIILHNGHVKGVFNKNEITEEEIVELSSGYSSKRRVKN